MWMMRAEWKVFSFDALGSVSTRREASRLMLICSEIVKESAMAMPVRGDVSHLVELRNETTPTAQCVRAVQFALRPIHKS